MFSNPEQFTSATKALLESQIAAFHTLGTKTVEGVEKTIALNIAAAKASMEQSIEVGKQLSSAEAQFADSKSKVVTSQVLGLAQRIAALKVGSHVV